MQSTITSGKFYITVALISFTFFFNGAAQKNSKGLFKTLSTHDMDGFRTEAGHWKIVGEVKCDSTVARAIETVPGSGILANLPVDKEYGDQYNLYSYMEHGDIDLEMDFLMAKSSNSGVYLEGRYEVQLYDSWGEKKLTSKDCGAIYERWDDTKPEGQKGYEGHPPKINVCKAPGVWQHLEISFQAPRFNKGKKISNAKFLKVKLNGALLHQNVEVTGPTRAAGFTDEKPKGPIMIQGDHGPVAFRNIKYKLKDKK